MFKVTFNSKQGLTYPALSKVSASTLHQEFNEDLELGFISENNYFDPRNPCNLYHVVLCEDASLRRSSPERNIL